MMVTFGYQVFRLDDELSRGCQVVAKQIVDMLLYKSVTPFQSQLLLWLQPPDIYSILNFRVDVVGAN